MRVLVTGGTGFLGRHVVWRLASLGHNVIFTGRDQAAAAQVLALLAGRAQYAPLEHGHDNAAERLVQLAAGADMLVHCAGLSSPWGRREAFERANVASAREALHACRHNRIARLVHISTPSVYFDFTDRVEIEEDAPLPAPVNDYTATKRQAEELLFSHAVDTEVVILRPRALFGPWDNTLMPRLLRVLRRGVLPVVRGGTALIDVTYIDNAVDAVCLALLRPLPARVRVYNVSNGEPLPIRALLTDIANAFGLSVRAQPLPYFLIHTVARLLEALTSHEREPLLTCYTAGVLAFGQTLSLKAIRRDLGYEPRVSIADGIERYAAWHRARGGVI